MMLSEFTISEGLARIFSTHLGDEFDNLSPESQESMRRVGYAVHVLLCDTRHEVLKASAETLANMITRPSTPKRWMPGLQEGAKELNFLALLESESTDPYIPDHVARLFTDPDPYAKLQAGEEDPFLQGPLPWDAVCRAENDGDWVCTRPIHPDHWQHWDSDPSVGDGRVLATWDETGELTSIDPAIVEAMEDDE